MEVSFDDANPFSLRIVFSCGPGGDFHVASGCDRDDGIDELLELSKPEVRRTSKEGVDIVFVGRTTLWEKVEYVFSCSEESVVYRYKVRGSGALETVRFFEGFLADDPRMDGAYYPYFCGPGRHMAYKRSVKEFMRSSTPLFDKVYSFGINSSDKREFGFYEDISIRVNGDRHYLGGDWLATPSAFLYLAGRKDADAWFSMGLAVKPGEAGFMSYDYSGGEGFGLRVDYEGRTRVDGEWESPAIVMCPSGADPYAALEKHVSWLFDNGYAEEVDRSDSPRWWRKPIFGGWGEQVYHSNRWDNYFSGRHDDWAEDNVDLFCTQNAYEKMLGTLESKGVDPTILIIDNRWFRNDAHLDVDTDMWPDLKGFVSSQHAKGRKVVLWVSPWSYCMSAKGKDVPIAEHMYVDEDDLFEWEIDTDVFYPERGLDRVKARRSFPMPEPTLTDANWRYVADPQNARYAERVRSKIRYLLSPDGIDADGFEFDYTHFIPKFRGTKPVTPRDEPTAWGIEALHRMVKLYYDGAKEVKSDALIISHTFNPYFNDVIDMLRLQDIYTDRKSIVPQMEHRAKIAKVVAPGCAIHTDQHPMPSLEAWREYAEFQPNIGNPCLYYVTGIETTKEKLEDRDFEMLSKLWREYNEKLEGE
jgi:hypothetical protein